MDEFRQAMIKTMAGKGEVVSEHYLAHLIRPLNACSLLNQNLLAFLLQPDDNQLAIIFMKVDANCDGTVDWV